PGKGRRTLGAAIGAVSVAVTSIVIAVHFGDESAMKPRPPPTFVPGDLTPRVVEAPARLATGRRLIVGAPVLAVSERQPPEPPPPPVPPGPNPSAITFPAAVHFAFGKATLRSRRRLVSIAVAVRRGQRVAGLRVDGHADDHGRPPFNLRLSIRRACTV